MSGLLVTRFKTNIVDIYYEKMEDTKVVFRIRKSKDRKYNDQKN